MSNSIQLITPEGVYNTNTNFMLVSYKLQQIQFLLNTILQPIEWSYKKFLYNFHQILTHLHTISKRIGFIEN